jgi:hypothetical protein
MTDARKLIESLRELPEEEIQRRLADIAAEEKALRRLLELRQKAEPRRRAGEAAK